MKAEIKIKERIMKKKSLFSIILVISILGCLLVNPVSAVSSSPNAYSVAHSYIEDTVTRWVKNNYGSHYYLRDIVARSDIVFCLAPKAWDKAALSEGCPPRFAKDTSTSEPLMRTHEVLSK